MSEPSPVAASGESDRGTARQALLATAVLLSIPTLAVLFTFLCMSFFLRSCRDDVHDASHVSRTLQTLPGRNGTWWVDDPHIYFLTPPAREIMVDNPLLRDEKIVPPEAFGNRRPVGFSYHRYFESFDKEGFRDKLKEDVRDKSNSRATVALKFAQTRNPFSDVGTLEWMWDEFPRSPTTGAAMHLRAVIAHKIGDYWLDESDVAEKSETEDGRSVTQESLIKEPRERGPTGRPQSKREWYAAAQQDYDAALALYYRHPYHNLALVALCQSDRGRLYGKLGQHFRAAHEFARTHQILANVRGADSVAGLDFSIDCLCQAAIAHRAEGNYGLARLQLNQARGLLGLPTSHLSDAGESEDDAALKAYVLERLGWINMDVWRVKEAGDCFRLAKKYRSHADHFPSETNRIETQISILHNQHGIAMANRYAGNGDEAAKDYAAVILDILELLGSTHHGELHVDASSVRRFLAGQDFGSQSQRGNRYREYEFKDIHESEHGLVDQIVNSLDRYADCHLYGWHAWTDSQAARAFEALEIAYRIQSSETLEIQANSASLARILCKQSLALVRRGDFQRAKQVLDKADELQPQADRSGQYKFLRDVARACLQIENDDYGGQLAKTLEDGFSELSRRRKFGRDELDVAVLAATFLFREQTAPKDSYADLLLNLALYPIEYRAELDETNEHHLYTHEMAPFFRGPYAISIEYCRRANPPKVELEQKLSDALSRIELASRNHPNK